MVNSHETHEFEMNVGQKKSFTIAANNNIFDILSNKMYERPIEAIVREVYSNAIDANIANKSKGKLEVTLPTSANPILKITDHGIGMSDEKIMKVYTEYGNSDKGDDNSQIGGFGIGCKTPFAYTDQFTVESCKDGIKSTYIAIKEDGGPSIIKAGSCPCNVSGTSVTIPVKENDFVAFVNAAVKVFFWAQEFPAMDEASIEAFLKVVRHTISGAETLETYLACREKAKTATLMGNFFNESLVAEIGGVMYGIDSNYFSNNFWSGTMIIHIPVGEVSVQASREKLNYDNRTTEKLGKYFDEAIGKAIKEIEDLLADKELSFYERHNFLKNVNVDRLNSWELTHEEVA